MKKLLIATAALAMVAGTAQAQSSVSVYGIMDIGVTSTKDSLTGGVESNNYRTVKNLGNGDGGLSTSRLGFRGTEDLGGGNKANFQLEYDLNDVGTGGQKTDKGFGTRYSWVGLQSNNMGQIRLGRQEQSIHSVIVGGSAGQANNVAGTIYSAGSADSGNTNYASIRPHAVFVDRAITYISPNMNGVTVELQTASNKVETTDSSLGSDAKQTQSGVSIKYAAGKLNVAYAQQSQSTSAFDLVKEIDDGTTIGGDKRKTQALSANYDFGVVKAFALHTVEKVTDDGFVLRKNKATELGAQMPMGNVTLFASTFQGSGNGGTPAWALGGAYQTDANGSINGGHKTKGHQVGALYSLSKRTTAYAIYGQQQIEQDGTDYDRDVIKSKATSFGVRHAF